MNYHSLIIGNNKGINMTSFSLRELEQYTRKIEGIENCFKIRAQKNWDTLLDEIDELPDFEDAYSTVECFYRTLPWE